MTANEYQEACMRFASDLSKSTNDNLLLQGVMGMNGEAGEAIDIVKKITFHGHPFDEESKAHLAKELGDVLWYIATSARAIGYDLSDIILALCQRIVGLEIKQDIKVSGWAF